MESHTAGFAVATVILKHDLESNRGSLIVEDRGSDLGIKDWSLRAPEHCLDRRLSRVVSLIIGLMIENAQRFRDLLRFC